MPALRSSKVTQGREATTSRMLWRATGMKDGDFDKPIVAVANSFTQFVPGHVHLKDMGQLVAREIEAVGGVARELNTIAVDDGIAMGHDGMLYSLPSRDLIADSIEYMVNAHCADAHAYPPDGGLAVLRGNLSPDGCVVRTAGVDARILRFKGEAIVFESENAAAQGIAAGAVKPGHVVVIRYEGPSGGPGMQEMLKVTSLLKSRGLDGDCAPTWTPAVIRPGFRARRASAAFRRRCRPTACSSLLQTGVRCAIRAAFGA